MEPTNLTESIYTSGLKSSFRADLLTNHNAMEDEINEDECDVQITDVGDFLGDLKEGTFQYVDMEEVNRRNNSSRFRPGGKSNINSSTVVNNSRFGGNRIGESRMKGSILSSKIEGKTSHRKFDLRERLKNLDTKIGNK